MLLHVFSSSIAKEKISILIYGTFENSSIALDSFGCKKGEGLSDGLRKEHLIQSGDDIKKCWVYGYARTKPKSKIVTMKKKHESPFSLLR